MQMGCCWWHLLAVGDFIFPDPALLPWWHRPGEDQAGGCLSVQAHRRHLGRLCDGDAVSEVVTPLWLRDSGHGWHPVVGTGVRVALTCVVDADAGAGHAAERAEG